MPLRDHFEPPVSKVASWEEVHGLWPAVIVQQLFPALPEGYVAAPRVHRGAEVEIDVATFKRNGESQPAPDQNAAGGAGAATAVAAPPLPTLEFDTELPDQDEYEVRVYDDVHARRLVAAVEIVSPSNKDCPENRRAFVAKCSALLQEGVSVSIVDLITSRNFNLYTDLLDMIRRSDPAFSRNPPAIYAVTCRGRTLGHVPKVAIWAHPLAVGKPLPQLPIWLTEELSITLDLEASYQETCRLLRIP
ncbi:MAG: DUF4058 family protein [Gemmataceae bacterium]|nr:DUF4058 family protein [Gemmataceae bacterium]